MQLWKNELLLQKKLATARKLERAEQKRQLQLQLKVRKAHEEETKVSVTKYSVIMSYTRFLFVFKNGNCLKIKYQHHHEQLCDSLNTYSSVTL